VDYFDVINELIAEKGLSQTQIFNKRKDLDVKISKRDLSNVTNKKVILTEEKNCELSKILGLDEEELPFMAYLQHAPEDLKKFVEDFRDIILNIIRLYINSGLPEEQFKEEIEKLRKSRSYEIVKTGWGCLDDIIDENSINIKFQNNEIKYAKPEFAPGQIIDNSMYPLIEKGNRIHYSSKYDVKIGDLVLLKILNKDRYYNCNFIRRYMIDEMGKYLFKAIDPNFPSFRLEKGEFEILYKVDRITKKV